MTQQAKLKFTLLIAVIATTERVLKEQGKAIIDGMDLLLLCKKRKKWPNKQIKRTLASVQFASPDDASNYRKLSIVGLRTFYS
jgi:hypothetical protein